MSPGGPPIQWSETIDLCNFKRGHHHRGNINAKFYEIWTSGSGGVDCRHFLSRALAAPLSVDWNHLCNFGRKHHEEQSCEIILNLDQWFRRKCSLKVILIWSSGSPFVQQSVTICAIFVVGIMRNNTVKLFWIWVSGSGEDVV